MWYLHRQFLQHPAQCDEYQFLTEVKVVIVIRSEGSEDADV